MTNIGERKIDRYRRVYKSCPYYEWPRSEVGRIWPLFKLDGRHQYRKCVATPVCGVRDGSNELCIGMLMCNVVPSYGRTLCCNIETTIGLSIGVCNAGPALRPPEELQRTV